MTDSDGGRQAAENFSHNIKARREAIGMSQEHLAEAMTARGFSFGQATIWKIESGQRGISLTEGLAIVEILSERHQLLTVDTLMQAPDSDQARQALESASADLAETSTRIEDAVAFYVRATQNYATAYAVATERTPDEQRTGAIWQWADPTAPELIALTARLHQAQGNGGGDAVLDAVAAFEESIKESNWPWDPWRPEGLAKEVPDNGEH